MILSAPDKERRKDTFLLPLFVVPCLIVNQFIQNDFLCLRLTVISQPYPFHLVGCFQFLGHTGAFISCGIRISIRLLAASSISNKWG
jgi:hypothetical protein